MEKKSHDPSPQSPEWKSMWTSLCLYPCWYCRSIQVGVSIITEMANEFQSVSFSFKCTHIKSLFMVRMHTEPMAYCNTAVFLGICLHCYKNGCLWQHSWEKCCISTAYVITINRYLHMNAKISHSSSLKRLYLILLSHRVLGVYCYHHYQQMLTNQSLSKSLRLLLGFNFFDNFTVT